MNDQKIFECLAVHGPLLAIDLAAHLLVDIDDATGQLAALVAVGDVKIIDGRYTFSEVFKRTPEYERIAKRATASSFAIKTQGEPEERAVLFLMSCGGRCTSSEMHRALGLEPDELASTVLRDALINARLFRDGKDWFVDRRFESRDDSINSAGLLEDLAAPASNGQPRAASVASIFSKAAPIEAQPVMQDEVPSEDDGIPTLRSFITTQNHGDEPRHTPLPVKSWRDECLRIISHRQNGLRLQRGGGDPLILDADETRRLRNYLVQHPEKPL